ncbi:class-II fumarase/aspartase family protein [Halosolutus halophilus]|uniref:class-II fumarase/aspartase family protein n=1 Tax=Halosolutus halophilus TaxID=1552990 RepID=UPI0022350009|nr:adenylosuccinate lyase family protein [Halosolutus halophilus]
MREIFDEASFVSTFLEVEAALARAEAEAGIVPEWAAAEITAKSSIEHVETTRIKEYVDEIGLFSMSIIEAWKEELGEAGEYVHWGASTQDISDTVVVIQLREAMEAIGETLLAVRDRLVSLADEHRETPMIGRTQHTNAPPITLGFKFATWLDEIERHLVRLRQLEERVYVAEFAGASGTLAAVGDDGAEILERFATELDLQPPRIGWTATRDRFAETLNLFAMIAGSLARIGRQVLLLNRPEIGELVETVPDDELGSSTNPHKRNPVLSQHTVGLARLVRATANVMNESLEPYDERDRSSWYVEFAVVPESAMYLHRALVNTRDNLTGLGVEPQAMERNVHRSGPLIASEAVMMALAEEIGRQTAHEVVHEAATTALDGDVSFREALATDSRVADHLSETRIESLTDPIEYIGLSTTFIDRVLEASGRSS